MPTYDIVRWDAVIPRDNTFPLPMLYIKGDENFVKYAKENNNYVLVTISGTDIYDGEVTGVIASSGLFPDLRPYYFNETGNFTIVIMRNWNGYPDNKGMVLVQGVAGPDALVKPAPIPFQAPMPIEWYDNKNSGDKKCNMKPREIAALFFFIAIVFIVLFAFSRRKTF
jgi:hypothetical protein